MNNPKISLDILITTYNSQAYVEKLINHIFKANISLNIDWQIIIGDDHSSDRTIDILQKCKNKYGKITIYEASSNEGPLLIRNELLNLCESDYVVFIDADDDFEENFFNCISDSENNDLYLSKRIYKFINSNKLKYYF